VIPRFALAALAILLAQPFATAQEWPARPLRAIIPFGAGSATDIVPRIVFEQLSPQLGQPIVVENRTGAGGTLGMSAVREKLGRAGVAPLRSRPRPSPT
jgi:tripartite-type tricarboxylate transporter receptor subunit TctC